MEIKLTLTISKQNEYELLNEFLKCTTINSKIISYNKDPITSLNIDELNTFNYIPNNEFKNFCGTEYLNQKGYISIHSAFDLLISYTKQHNIYFKTYIDMNETLAKALKSDNHSILISEIPNLLISLFTSVTK